METILITGGLGYIGSHTTLKLLEKGKNILIIDSLDNSTLDTLSKIKFLINSKVISEKKGILYFRKGDLKNKIWLEKIFEEFIDSNNKISSVLHFAGLKSVEESIIYPLKYWETNIGGTLNLLNTMIKNNCFTIIFSSSAMVYKINSMRPFKESNELDPLNPYAFTKYSIEKILYDLFKSAPSKWRIANLRYFNPVGAHESGILGENPKRIPSNLFPSLIDSLKKNNRYFKIYGNDWPTSDGTCIRDFIHIMDLADAHIAAYEYITEGKAKINIFNIGTGHGTSILEIIKTFESVNKFSIQYKYENRRTGDVPYLVADTNYANEILNWKSKKKLEEICKDTWRWFNKNYK